MKQIITDKTFRDWVNVSVKEKLVKLCGLFLLPYVKALLLFRMQFDALL